MPAWLVKEEVRDLFPDHAAAIGAPGEEINGNPMSRLVRYRDGDDYYYIKTYTSRGVGLEGSRAAAESVLSGKTFRRSSRWEYLRPI